MTLVMCDASSCYWNRDGMCRRGQVNLTAYQFNQIVVECGDYETKEGE